MGGRGTPSQSLSQWQILDALLAHFLTTQRSGGDQGRSESPYLGSEGSDDSKPSTKGKGKGKAAKKGKSNSFMDLLVLIAWTIDDGDFSIHRKRVPDFLPPQKLGPDSSFIAWITSSYTEEIKEGKDYW